MKCRIADKGLIIGVKRAHYEGPEWAPFERAVEVGAQLGHLSVGAVADVAVLRVEKGTSAFSIRPARG